MKTVFSTGVKDVTTAERHSLLEWLVGLVDSGGSRKWVTSRRLAGPTSECLVDF